MAESNHLVTTMKRSEEEKQQNIEVDENIVIDPFDMKMHEIFKRDKPFVNSGPQILRPEMQRTQCQLFLKSDDSNDVSLFRATKD